MTRLYARAAAGAANTMTRTDAIKRLEDALAAATSMPRTATMLALIDALTDALRDLRKS